MKKGCFRPIVDNEMCLNNKGCHRCYDVCPGIGVNLQQLTRECFTVYPILGLYIISLKFI